MSRSKQAIIDELTDTASGRLKIMEEQQEIIGELKEVIALLEAANRNLKEDLEAAELEIKGLKKVILLAPGSNEKDFQENYRVWWDTYYREIRTPGCNLKTLEQALKGGD